MRWLGLAQRAQDWPALRRGAAAFGRLADLGMVQAQVADSEIDLAATRALLWRLLGARPGRAGLEPTSIAKAFVAEAVGRVVDRAVQMRGGLGVSDDLPWPHLRRGAAVPHLRRRLGGAPLVDRPARRAPGGPVAEPLPAPSRQ